MKNTDKVLSYSTKMKGGILDDDYTLFESGKILHEFDRNSYPGGYNLKEELTADQIDDEIRNRLLEAAAENDKERVKQLLKIA